MSGKFEIHISLIYFIYSSLFYFKVLKKFYSNSFDKIKKEREREREKKGKKKKTENSRGEMYLAAFRFNRVIFRLIFPRVVSSTFKFNPVHSALCAISRFFESKRDIETNH